MGFSLNPLSFITEGIKSVGGIIDKIHTSDDERLTAKQELLSIQVGMSERVLQYERDELRDRASVIKAEATSGNFLAANWRPITMLVFVSLITAHWFGLTAPNLSEGQIVMLMEIVKLGIGGYVIGRSAEKVIPGIIGAMKKTDNVK